MPTLLHLNGASGVGKSTLARAVAEQRPGTLVCDIDELRTWVSGWSDDFVAAGERVRSSALALITAYLRTGHDVVLPQLVVSPTELDRFREAAVQADADYVCAVLTLDEQSLLSRLRARERTPLVEVVDRVIAERGGDNLVLRGQRDLIALTDAEPDLTLVGAAHEPATVKTLGRLLARSPGHRS